MAVLKDDGTFLAYKGSYLVMPDARVVDFSSQYESASTIHHVLLTKKSTCFSFRSSIKTDHPNFQDGRTVSIDENPIEIVKWLRTHRSSFSDLDFSVRVDLIYPDGELGDMGAISQYFAEAVSNLLEESAFSNRFFLSNFDPNRNQAAFRFKGQDLTT